jgi:hypothetical protein
LLTPERVAEILGVKVQTLALWRTTMRYKLAYSKIGRKVMYRETDVIRFVESRTHGADKAA